MNRKKRPDKELAAQQWDNLHKKLKELGADIQLLAPSPKTPDLVFTANAGLVRGKKVVVSNFKYPQRQTEEAINEEWFETQGYELLHSKKYSFEGEGDALFAGEKLFCGYGFRSEADAFDFVCESLEVSSQILCEMKDSRFYHLDTCFTPLNEKQALFVQSAFTKDSIRKMENEIELFDVSGEEALRFICNSVIIDNNIITPEDCPESKRTLEKLGFSVHSVQLNQFLKAGGSAKCLTLKLWQD